MGHHFPAISEKTDPSFHQMIELSSKKYMLMPPLLGVEFHPEVHRCATGIMLPYARKVDCSSHVVRGPLAGVPLMVRRIKGVFWRPDPCQDRLSTLKNPSCP